MLVGAASYPRLFFKLASQGFPAGVMGETNRGEVVEVERKIRAALAWLDVVDAQPTIAFAA